MLRRLAVLAFLFQLGAGLSACGPATLTEDDDNGANESQEASEFRKSAEGTWTACFNYQDNSGSLRSEQRRMAFADKTAKISMRYYSSAFCAGNIAKSEQFNATVKVKDAASKNHVVIEILSTSQTDLQIYRQTMETKLNNNNTMSTRMLGMTLWMNGSEQAVSDSDLNAYRDVLYAR